MKVTEADPKAAAADLPLDAPCVADPVESLEVDLRNMAIESARNMLAEILPVLDRDNPSVARALHLAEQMARGHLELLASLGARGAVPRKRAGIDAEFAGFGDQEQSTGAGSNVAETFGAQFVQQIVSVLGRFVDGKAEADVKAKRRIDGFGVQALVHALSEAKRAGLDDVADKLSAAIDGALEGGVVVPEGGLPSAAVPVPVEAFVPAVDASSASDR